MKKQIAQKERKKATQDHTTVGYIHTFSAKMKLSVKIGESTDLLPRCVRAWKDQRRNYYLKIQ
jgi:hypothetical protein